MPHISSRSSCSLEQRRCTLASSMPSRPLPLPVLAASAAAAFLCFCSSALVSVSATVCLGANCLAASPYFDEVYADYQPREVGYEYTVTLLRFFLSLVCIIVAVWLIRWYMDFRVVWELASAVREERVMRIPAEWASARNSITRDVLAAWMQRQDKPIVPVGVNSIQVPVHTSMAAAKLQIAPGTILPPLTLPSSPSSPSSPAGLEYVLKLLLSSSAHRSALVEVYLGVPMKLVVQLISDYERFAKRNKEGPGAGAGNRKQQKSKQQKRGKQMEMHELASPSAAVQRVFTSRNSAHPRLTGTGAGGVVEVEMATTAGPATPRGGGGFVAHRGRGSNPPPAPIVVDAGLPGSAPSRNNSPSHVTALSESKHLSQLSLREQPARGQSAHDSRSPFFDHDHTDGRGSLTPRSPPLTAAAAPSASPSSPPAKGGVASPIAVLGAHEGSHLFARHEYLHALPPTLFASGSKQQVCINFPAVLLHETLRDISLCPMLIFLTGVDDSIAVPLASPSAAAAGAFAAPLSPARLNAQQGRAQASPTSATALSPSSPLSPSPSASAFASRRPLIGELTIVQFSPAPASSHHSAAAAAAAAKQAAALSLPALAITTSDPAELAASNAAGDGEEKEAKDDDGDEEEKKTEVQSPTAATSPGAASSHDSFTSRAKFERQLVVTDEAVYEMEELYGMDESDAECIICLTEIRDTILLPCKHVCVCADCHKGISKCPICRARITKFCRFTKPMAEEEEENGAKKEE